MKKLSTIAVVAIFGALTFASCKKDYTCTCHIHIPGDTSMGVAAYDTTVATPLGKKKKSDAKSACDNTQSTANTQYQGIFGADASVSCGI